MAPDKPPARSSRDQLRTLKHVATEMALHVLADNMKRVITITGTPGLIKAIKAFLSWIAAPIARGCAILGSEKFFKAI